MSALTNPNAALVFYEPKKQALIVLDGEGSEIAAFTTMTHDKAVAELKKFAERGDFSALPRPLEMAINLNLVEGVTFSGNFNGKDAMSLRISGKDDTDIANFALTRHQTLARMRMNKASEFLFQVSRREISAEDRYINTRLMKAIKHDEKTNKLQFRDQKGNVITTDKAFTKEEATPVMYAFAKGRKAMNPPPAPPAAEEAFQLKNCPNLSKFGINLTRLAFEGKMDPIEGRDQEVKRMEKILNRRRKPNPMLIGEPGSGKTALVEGLALKIAKGEVGTSLKDKIIVNLQLSSVVAGTNLRGMFEERMEAIVNEAAANPNVILFIDEIHTVMGAGSAQGAPMGADNILKPALARGTIRCIGATTQDEYQQYIESDAALERRFQSVVVDELDREASRKALGRQVEERYKPHFGIEAPADVLDAIVDFCEELDGSTLIDRSLDVVDESMSGAQLEGRDTLTIDDVKTTIAEKNHMPASLLGRSDQQVMEDLEKGFAKAIIAQPKAKAALMNAIKRARAGIHDPNKPLGKFLFLGPSGVGKTALAKTLSLLMNMNFVHLDMSDYQEKHSVSRLVGTSPGFVGFEQDGELTGPVRRRPHSVVLADEIEKAASDVQNIFLQLLDEGRVKDGKGRTTRFNHAFFIAAGNLNAKPAPKVGPQASAGPEVEGSKKDLGEEVTGFFTKAVLGRFDAIISFDPLLLEEVAQIADRFLEERSKWIQRHRRIDVKYDVTDEAKAYLAALGMSEDTGARELSSVIQSQLDDRIADEIISGNLAKGGTAHIDLETDEDTGQDKLTFKFSAAVENAPAQKASNDNAAVVSAAPQSLTR